MSSPGFRIARKPENPRIWRSRRRRARRLWRATLFISTAASNSSELFTLHRRKAFWWNDNKFESVQCTWSWKHQKSEYRGDDAGGRVLGLGAKRMRGTCSSAQVYPESQHCATTPMGNCQLQHFKGIVNRKRTGAYIM
jgi:hypothetical protein